MPTSYALQCYECSGKYENCLTGLRTCEIGKIRCLVINYKFKFVFNGLIKPVIFYRKQ